MKSNILSSLFLIATCSAGIMYIPKGSHKIASDYHEKPGRHRIAEQNYSEDYYKPPKALLTNGVSKPPVDEAMAKYGDDREYPGNLASESGKNENRIDSTSDEEPKIEYSPAVAADEGEGHYRVARSLYRSDADGDGDDNQSSKYDNQPPKPANHPKVVDQHSQYRKNDEVNGKSAKKDAKPAKNDYESGARFSAKKDSGLFAKSADYKQSKHTGSTEGKSSGKEDGYSAGGKEDSDEYGNSKQKATPKSEVPHEKKRIDQQPNSKYTVESGATQGKGPSKKSDHQNNSKDSPVIEDDYNGGNSKPNAEVKKDANYKHDSKKDMDYKHKVDDSKKDVNYKHKINDSKDANYKEKINDENKADEPRRRKDSSHKKPYGEGKQMDGKPAGNHKKPNDASNAKVAKGENYRLEGSPQDNARPYKKVHKSVDKEMPDVDDYVEKESARESKDTEYDHDDGSQEDEDVDEEEGKETNEDEDDDGDKNDSEDGDKDDGADEDEDDSE